MDACVVMAASLCCPPETIAALLGYDPMQRKKFKKKIKRSVAMYELKWSGVHTDVPSLGQHCIIA